MKTAQRGAIAPFYVMQALSDAQKLAARGADIVHLSLGQPSAKPPQRVLDKLAQMAAADKLGYTESAGIWPLRERIAQHYAQQYGLHVDAERIFITVGSSAAYMLALLAAFDVGDTVALVAPHYPASPNMMQALGLKPLIIESGAKENYQPTLEQMKSLAHKPQGLVIASPSNPAGTVIDSAELACITAYCEAEGIRMISDEIYHGVTYADVQAETILRFSEDMIVTNSFSKYYLLPGWRLGWCVMPPDLLAHTEALLQNFYISPPTLSQYAALEVMDCRDDLDAVVRQYERNRQYLLEQLPLMGLSKIAPAQGAFYLYVDVSHLTQDSADFCRQMLSEAGVCAVPGIDFDKRHGQRFVRFSYAGSLQQMQKACERLQGWIAGYKAAS